MERASDEAPIRAQMVIGGESVDAADGQTFDVVNPATGQGHRDGAARRAGGRRPGGRGRPGAHSTIARAGRPGPPASAAGRWPSSPSLIKANTEELAQLESRNVGQADHQRARRDHRREPRLRLLRGRRQQDLRPDDPGLEAGARPDAARADRRGRADRALELPVVDGLVEGGARRWPPGTPRSSSPPATPR